ncbi:WD repeat-containing protein 47-like isoform X1 [Glandiceps talaboti]
MTATKINLKEREIIKLVLEFLHSRELYLSMRGVERETGSVNGLYSDDLLFLRSLILDGQWDDVMEFVQPLESIESFDSRNFRYVIMKHKFLEMVCMKSEDPGNLQVEFSIDEVVGCLRDLEPYCPSKEDYNSLCLLLTLPRLTDHADYKNWNPSNARVQCFKDVLPLIGKFLPADKNMIESEFTASNDRLVQLMIKGLLYESCVEFCQQKATSKDSSGVSFVIRGLLYGSPCDDADLSLLSWLQSIPSDTFTCAFEQKTLDVNMEKLDKPKASWSEQIMTPLTPTPVKQRGGGYPSPSPSTPTLYRGRPWSSGSRVFTQSLSPSVEGFLQRRQSDSERIPQGDALSKSFANFHMSPMNRSPGLTMPGVAEDVEDGVIRRSSSRAPGPASPKPKQKPASPQPAQVQGPPQSPKFNQTGAIETRESTQMYQQHQQDRERLQHQLQQRERERELLQQQLMNTPSSSSSTSSVGQPSHHGSSITSAPSSQMTPGFPVSHSQSPPPPQASIAPSPRQHSRPIGPIHKLQTSFSEQAKTGSAIRGLNMTYSAPPRASQDHDTYIHHRTTPLPGGLPPHSDARHDGKSQAQSMSMGDGSKFYPVTTLEDVQAIRAVAFNPTGSMYAVGSNSKTLRICAYPEIAGFEQQIKQPTILYKRNRHHKGSIYCVAWSPTGDLIATGSNDKAVKLMRFDVNKCNADGPDTELTMHNGTVRDLTFLTDPSSVPLLLSGGAGDCSVYMTDCNRGENIHALSGHSGHVLSLFTWANCMLASGAQDKTVRFWDLRTPRCVNIIGSPGSDRGDGSSVTSICVDPTDRLLATAQEDCTVMLYDIRGSRVVQTFTPHEDEARSARFAPNSYCLLTGSYDSTITETDLKGDLTKPLQSTVVAEHKDKVIQCRWHPTDLTFLSSSADKTATLWAKST